MAALSGQLKALSKDKNLRRFVVQARPIGKQLGTGSYGTVEEVEVNGLVCAGKKIHKILLDVGNIGVRDIAAKYVQECQLMSDLRHPNIILFLGLCFLPNSQLPVLVMERLDSSLDDLLETVPNIPLTLKRSILEDIARGLLYLHKHNPQVIHRDLTAKNVLLTSSLVAKITDLGNSRIVNIQPGQLAQTLSRNPGTLVYMPPEALTAASRYGSSLDIFSFGHLGIFIGLQIFPGDLLEPTYADPENHGRLLGRSELERRQEYFVQLKDNFLRGEQHPFVQLVKRCLKNKPSDRPTAEEVITSLEEMKADIEGPYGEVARADAVRQVAMMRALKKRESEVKEKTDESAAKDEEIHLLQQELEHEQARAKELLTSQFQQKDTEIQQQVAELQFTRTQLQEKDVQIHQREAELRQTRTQFQQEVATLNGRLVQLHADLRQREAQLRVKDEDIGKRDAEISRLTEELWRCQKSLRQAYQEIINFVISDSSATVQKSFLNAVKRGQLDKVKAFHQQGAKLTLPDSNGWSPLHHAARLGRTEIVQYIVKNIPREALDIVEDEKLQTALHKAAWFGYKDICKILIEKGASVRRTDYQYNTPYDKAVQSGDVELQQYLKQKN